MGELLDTIEVENSPVSVGQLGDSTVSDRRRATAPFRPTSALHSVRAAGSTVVG